MAVVIHWGIVVVVEVPAVDVVHIPVAVVINAVGGGLSGVNPGVGGQILVSIVDPGIDDTYDDTAVAVLKRCREAMPRDARLLVIDGIIEQNEKSSRILKLLDLEQMLWLDGRIRTWAEWNDLFKAGGLRMTNATKTDIADAAIMEIQIAVT